MRPFEQAVSERPLLWDGGMGTLLFERGVFLTRSFEELNLSNPQLISQVHREYVAAGADIIETNTFGANRIVLGRHGFEGKLADINTRGVRLAREIARERNVYVAGSVGPSCIEYDHGVGR